MSMTPRINGNTYSHTSLRIYIGGIPFPFNGVKELSYSWKLDPGKVMGTNIKKLGRTSGQMELSGSITMFREEADKLRQLLGSNYSQLGLDITIYMEEPNMEAKKDTLKGVRFISSDKSSSAGSDPLSEKMDLDIMDICENGIWASSEFVSDVATVSSITASVTATVGVDINMF